jgi:hypothetical protein
MYVLSVDVTWVAVTLVTSAKSYAGCTSPPSAERLPDPRFLMAAMRPTRCNAD